MKVSSIIHAPQICFFSNHLVFPHPSPLFSSLVTAKEKKERDSFFCKNLTVYYKEADVFSSVEAQPSP